VPNRRLLDATELLAKLPEEMRVSLAQKGTEHTLDKGDLLFQQGDPSDSLFVVLDGQVAVATRSNDGRESLVAVFEPGGLFGDMGMFDGEPRSADARALDDSRVLGIPYTDVRAALEARPELLWVVARVLAQRLRATDEALADAVFLDVPARTAKRLLELAGDSDAVDVPMTQEDLAGLVGASRERVNKALSLFLRVGWLEQRGRGSYRILDRAALEQRAEVG
jgi:CRP/FNR family transcriptional regulator, cyclic AMP receptor protein